MPRRSPNKRGFPSSGSNFRCCTVRRDLQYRLRREGYNMRVYVPFGTHWYPYLMRRLAERPANVAFITSNIRSEEHTSELQSQSNLVCRLLLEKKKKNRAVF